MHEYEACPSRLQDVDIGNGHQQPPSVFSTSMKDEPIPPRRPDRSKWTTVWRVQAVVIGFLILSIFVAAAHWGFFQYLDGRIIDPGVNLTSGKTTKIPQGYVTTISLLLTTGFRAALVASVGVCYTQYLWGTLRNNVFKASLVEDLFQIQTNVFHLASPSIYIKTPVLAAIAIFCWLVPIATVYPPGSLVVELHSTPVDSTFNVSVLHAQDYMYTTYPEALSEIWCHYVNGENQDTIGPLDLYREEAQNASFLNTCMARMGQSVELRYITRSSLMSGELAALNQPTGENSSYALQFWGTTLECETVNRTIERPIFEADVTVRNYSWPIPGWKVQNFSSDCELWSNEDFNSLFEDPKITFRNTSWSSRAYRYYPCLEDLESTSTEDQDFGRVSLPQTGIRFLIDVTETTCRPKLMKYSVEVSFAGGTQQVASVLTDDEPTPSYSASFDHFDGSYEQWVQFSDAMSIYYEFAANLNRSTIVDYPETFNYTNSSTTSTFYTGSNGTVETCLLNRNPISAFGDSRAGHRSWDLEIWPLSVFERRNPIINAWGEIESGDCPRFDTELAKELLMNTTISALTLNKQFKTVNGTISRAFNVYRFRDKLSFFLPYGLSIVLSVPMIVLGLVAFFVHNGGTSAITGGFLQLLMTTTGRTMLEDRIKGAGTMGGHENISEELKAADITFGALIDADEKPPSRSTSSAKPAGHGLSSDASLLDGTHRDEISDVSLDLEASGKNGAQERRAGFGLAQEVRQLKGRPV